MLTSKSHLRILKITFTIRLRLQVCIQNNEKSQVIEVASSNTYVNKEPLNSNYIALKHKRRNVNIAEDDLEMHILDETKNHTKGKDSLKANNNWIMEDKFGKEDQLENLQNEEKKLNPKYKKVKKRKKLINFNEFLPEDKPIQTPIESIDTNRDKKPPHKRIEINFEDNNLLDNHQQDQVLQEKEIRVATDNFIDRKSFRNKKTKSKKRENNVILLHNADDNIANNYISTDSYKVVDDTDNNQTEFISNLMNFKEDPVIKIDKNENFELPIDPPINEIQDVIEDKIEPKLVIKKENVDKVPDEQPINQKSTVPIYQPEAFDSPAKLFKNKKKKMK